MRLTGISHTSFTVSDMDRSLAFYRDVLGMVLILEVERKGEYIEQVVGFPGASLRIVGLKLPSGSDHILELIEYRVPRGERIDLRTCNPGSPHLCFVTDDIQAAYQELRGKGVQFKSAPVRIPSGPSAGGYDAYFLDPDGITLELAQPAPPRSQ
jgi:catechol 2,3-dioxygenase-like lactoylglutathione lyase family enzyme